MNKNELNKLEKLKEIALIIFICVVGFYAFFNILPDFTIEADENWGPIGDFIGGIMNPILSFIGLLAILTTIRLQVKQLENAEEELKLTRHELKETRQATQDSSKALKEQSESIKIQNFENTFFKMIELHNNIKDNLKMKECPLSSNEVSYLSKEFCLEEKITLEGKDVINFIYEQINYISDDDNCEHMKFEDIYDYSHEEYQEDIGQYFGNIYQILKFISKSDLENKRQYSDLYRAQFSMIELKLLFFHCVGEIGSRKFKNYIEEFEFFEHLKLDTKYYTRSSLNNNYILYKEIYDLKAFGRNKENIKKATDEIIKNRENYMSEDYNNLLSLKFHFDKKEYQKSIDILEKLLSFPHNRDRQENLKKIIAYIKQEEEKTNSFSPKPQ